MKPAGAKVSEAVRHAKRCCTRPQSSCSLPCVTIHVRTCFSGKDSLLSDLKRGQYSITNDLVVWLLRGSIVCCTRRRYFAMSMRH